MSKPMTSDLFKFSGRRNRKSYLYFLLAAIAVQIVISAVVAAVGAVGEGVAIGALVVAVPVWIVLAVASLAVGSQRCRDFGWTGWAMLLVLIPVLGAIFALAMIFIPGNQGDNRYGPDPLQQYA